MQSSGVTFGAANYGRLNVLLEVMDTDGLTGSTTGSVLIDHKPTASFTISPSSGDTNTVFSFDASSSSDPDWATEYLDVRWDWEADGTYDTPWASATSVVSHVFNNAGTHTVRMQIQQFDGSLTDTTTRQVTVTEAAFSLAYLPMIGRSFP
jgi:PKD repeat protein